MTLTTPPLIEPLGPRHDRAAFSCGEAALDGYLRQQASQDVRRRVAQVFVALGDQPQEIAGYYSVSAASFRVADLPADQARRMPHYPVPAALLGRLAVDRAWQGRRLGAFLLLDAVRRVLQASAAMAIYAVAVDAKTEGAARFYQRLGFIPFPSDPGRLFLPLETVAKAGL